MNRALKLIHKLKGHSIIIILFCTAGISFSFCTKEKNSLEIKTFITRIDVPQLADKYFSEFDLIQRSSRNINGFEYYLKNSNNNSPIFINVAIYSCEETADTITKSIIYNSSAGFMEGIDTGVTLGNKFWYQGGPDRQSIWDVYFIRKNAVIRIYNPWGDYANLFSLAKKIDDDIMNEAKYVDLENTIRLPVIFSITSSRKILKKGEKTRLTIHAADPYNEGLTYCKLNGGSYFDSDPENVFTIYISPGMNIYRFVVVSERNIVSEIAEYEIFITE